MDSFPSSASGDIVPPQADLPQRRWLLLVPIVGGTCLLLTAVALIVVLLGRDTLLSDSETYPGISQEVIKITPSPTIPSTFASPVPPPRCETIISSGDTELAAPLPLSLTVGDQAFTVVPIVSDGTGWTYPAAYSGSAAWICGTVVNYVLELEPIPENEALLANLKPGDEIALRLSNGTELLFRFAERQEVPENEASVLEQYQPRSTLIVKRESGTWQVATADYVAEAESTGLPSGTPVELNESVRVGDAQVTVTKWHIERSRSDLQPGTVFYLVEFSIENVGSESLDADVLTMQLQDGAGNWYLLSSPASAAGENGQLSGDIAPGMTVQGTAGYVVPEMLAGPALIWTFSPEPGAELQASVRIPYEVGSQPVSIDYAEASVTDAFLSQDGNTMIIEGEVRNTGGELLTVVLNDISCTSSAGMSELRMAAPPLPWTIEPGQTQVIELQYAKPDASAALLTLLGYSFEIQGLR